MGFTRMALLAFGRNAMLPNEHLLDTSIAILNDVYTRFRCRKAPASEVKARHFHTFCCGFGGFDGRGSVGFHHATGGVNDAIGGVVDNQNHYAQVVFVNYRHPITNAVQRCFMNNGPIGHYPLGQRAV